jgi:parallel beta-helix repeat protein
MFNIGQSMLADMGGVYTLGDAPGTLVSGNLIREVRSYAGYGPTGAGGGWGIFGDEGSSNVTVSNNVVAGTDNGGYRLAYGQGNIVQNNMFAWGDVAEFGLHVSDPQNTLLQSSSNLMIPLSSLPFDQFATSPDVIYSSNMVSSQSLQSGTADLTKCLPGCSTSAATLGTTAKPKGVTLAGATTSMASMVSTTLAQAGPANSPWYAKDAVAARAAPILAPPLDLTIDIAGAALGSQPAGLMYSAPGNAQAIQVVSKSGSPSNGQCLQFADTPSFANYWDPHAYAVLNHTTGTSTAVFSLWIDANSLFTQEWRDHSVPYKVGPSFRISSQGVVVNSQAILPVKINSWNTFTVVAPVGTGAGTWSVKVTDSGGVSQQVGNLPVAAGWKELDWLGLISLANTTTTACLGSLSITSK